jgi:hypothetical protein
MDPLTHIVVYFIPTAHPTDAPLREFIIHRRTTRSYIYKPRESLHRLYLYILLILAIF